MKTLLPGLIPAILLAAAAAAAARCCSSLNAVCTAIFLGLLLSRLFRKFPATVAGLDFAEKRMLPCAIAFMGLELDLQSLKEIGTAAPLVTLPAMALSISVTAWVGTRMRIPLKTALLTGIGNSVCGSSAVLAAAPALQSGKEERGLAVTSVNLAGTVGIFLLPLIAHAIGMSAQKTAYLLGGSLQAVGQVAAAAISVSEQVTHQALVIKMLRVLMIGPIVILLTRLNHSEGAAQKAWWKHVPGYMFGFAACSILSSLFHSSTALLNGFTATGRFMLTVAMVAIGSSMEIRTLCRQGGGILGLTLLSSLILTGTVLLLSALFL
ncbi:YeiH family protein [Pontiella agarivorans]|uniref:Sulfate exporter family transporter n=1 Tax=Pontiella agarivorans TaxID=3038953 RepID=A0ABU5MVE1_9BACT|nr:putative sulfate exporter family transporter [Pontiella agarivorans]MDZ8118194.1 putative sulfate exporter family transporter [Pontiella agarivorans]